MFCLSLFATAQNISLFTINRDYHYFSNLSVHASHEFTNLRSLAYRAYLALAKHGQRRRPAVDIVTGVVGYLRPYTSSDMELIGVLRKEFLSCTPVPVMLKYFILMTIILNPETWMLSWCLLDTSARYSCRRCIDFLFESNLKILLSRGTCHVMARVVERVVRARGVHEDQ